jgi:DNA processing protein
VQSLKDVSVTDLHCWIALRFVFGIGNVNYKNLINHFGSPEKVLQAPSEKLEQVDGITSRAVESIRNFKPDKAIDKEIELIYKKNITIITLNDPAYPENLKNIYDPPPFLYVKGCITKNDDNAIAVVGSRNASEYGISATERISRELARSGFTIVSGMARGIDSTAHYGALSAKGRTIAILGSGIDVVYPSENRQLYESIAEHGAVISEFAIGTEPNAYNFPARNRIISGLSLGVLVVEASLKSGSLITARLALEQGRDVFAVPGNVHSYKSKGTHRLLKEGAKLVESAQDILDEIRVNVSATGTDEKQVDATIDLSTDSRSVYQFLQEDPVYIDELIVQTGFTSSQISAILLDLELNGLIKQLPGKRFAKVS